MPTKDVPIRIKNMMKFKSLKITPLWRHPPRIDPKICPQHASKARNYTITNRTVKFLRRVSDEGPQHVVMRSRAGDLHRSQGSELRQDEE